MNDRLLQLTRTLTKRPGAIPSAIDEAMAVLNLCPPQDYVDFLLESNGAEGFMPGGRYLMLDSVVQLVPCKEPYGVGSSGPGLVAFGSDGASMLFAFDVRQLPLSIVEVDSTCMELSPVTPCGHTFLEFLEYMNTRD
jgi:hypothetical protein